jgi:hypothetical protein
MDKIDMTFLRTVLNRIDDCTSPIQLREVLERYKPYLYNGQIQEAFISRLDIIKGMSNDEFNDEKCEELEEELELEVQISSVCKLNQFVPEYQTRPRRGRRKDKPLKSNSELTIEINFTTKEGDVLEDAINAVVQVIIEKSLGKKKEAGRILGMDYKELSARLREIPALRKHMKKVKQELRKSDIVKKL